MLFEVIELRKRSRTSCGDDLVSSFEGRKSKFATEAGATMSTKRGSQPHGDIDREKVDIRCSSYEPDELRRHVSRVFEVAAGEDKEKGEDSESSH